MTSVFFDASFDDESRRQHLYQGNLFAFSPRPSTVALIEFARVLSTLKPRFIHHPQSKRLLSGILTEFGCDLSKTYFDVPKMRSMAHGDYLKAGIALPFDLHRDSWFASPLCQQNWWIPIYEIGPEDSMAFHPHYWDKP